MSVWPTIERFIAEHGAAVLVTLADAQGSSPREPGARMVVRPDGGLTFSSSYAEITKEFSISQIDGVFASLPASVWVEGKSIGVQQINLASEADHQRMDQITEKLTAFFSGKGYRVRRLPQ